MEIDKEKVDEFTLALLYLTTSRTSMGRCGRGRAMIGMCLIADFDN